MIVPDFNRSRYEGMMNPSERKVLYDLCIDTRPEIVIETGTCRGGGSTYFISTALRNNEKGRLYTCENNKEFYDYAIDLYNREFTEQKNYVKFLFGNSLDEISRYLPIIQSKHGGIDIALVDGGESSMLCVYDFTMLRPFIKVGGYFICHDWDNGKTQYLRPILENEHDFQLVCREVGLVVYKRINEYHTGRVHA